uniref:TonB-dependent receptor plug domain-containing protein n=1 Tax=uncultured Altererythrobacter sp. TaxID=500840 RepID=UPI00262D77AB|nr:TonB-dependent receptor plug domain-containing protein [uncultured Altererythrobacter sp.]
MAWSSAANASEASAATASAREPGAPAATMDGRVFEPEYFERFAPRNALDMLLQVPGFLLQGGGGGGGRGFGQANENVLVNGQRLTSKSESAQDQLRRIPAGKVIRIEIVDGTALDIPGLTGQVANVIVESGGISGQFTWEGAVRTTEVGPEWYGGEISISGSTGALDYTFALENNNNRFGGTGPSIFADGSGDLIERRDVVRVGAFDLPRISTALGYDFGDGTIANVNAYFGHTFFDRIEEEDRQLADGSQFDRINTRRGSTPEYEISGDISFDLGAGRLKLIGLESYDAEENRNTLVDTEVSSGTVSGDRFVQTGGEGERIARFEYNWPMLGGDWQLAGEAAFNRLNLDGRLFELDPQGEFVEIAFLEGTGGVREDRYETILSYSRQLTEKLALQASVGGEYSEIEQTGSAANSRTSQRPKGSLSLAWQPEDGFDISIGIERRVGQLSFGDFLAQIELDENNENAGNNQLVPSQTWEVVAEISKTLGDWGTTTLFLEQRWIDDFTDIIPLSGGGESRGNIDKARRTEIEWTTTLQLDPAGWRGAQLDIRLEYEEGEVRDPVTGRLRDFSGGRDREVEIDFRHDVPGSNWAYGGGFEYNRERPSFRLSQIRLRRDLPNRLSAFVEHKDVFGLTVNLEAANLLSARDEEFRTVFVGPRTDGIVRFTEDRSFREGPIFRFNISGNF